MIKLIKNLLETKQLEVIKAMAVIIKPTLNIFNVICFLLIID